MEACVVGHQILTYVGGVIDLTLKHRQFGPQGGRGV